MGGMGGGMGGMGGGRGVTCAEEDGHGGQRWMSGFAFSLAPIGRYTEVPLWNFSGKLRHV